MLPLNIFTCVTGVDQAQESSVFIKGILYPAMKRHLDEVADALENIHLLRVTGRH